MADDAVTVLPNGAAMDRDGVVDPREQAPEWRTYTIEDVRLIHPERRNRWCGAILRSSCPSHRAGRQDQAPPVTEHRQQEDQVR